MLFDSTNYKKHKRVELTKYLLRHPCVDCGESDVRCLEFDHVRGKKRLAISKMMSSNHSWKTVTSEIKKCEVRCSNCHSKKTLGTPPWFVDLAAFAESLTPLKKFLGIQHGKRHSYTYHECRCALCTEAQRNYMSSFRYARSVREVRLERT